MFSVPTTPEKFEKATITRCRKTWVYVKGFDKRPWVPCSRLSERYKVPYQKYRVSAILQRLHLLQSPLKRKFLQNVTKIPNVTISRSSRAASSYINPEKKILQNVTVAEVISTNACSEKRSWMLLQQASQLVFVELKGSAMKEQIY